MKQRREVAIVHYNTPELTEAGILSLRKHGGARYHVTVFDNSDERPFTAKMKGVTVIDNTHGQIIDFDKELAKFPDREDSIGVFGKCVYGSAKHMMTVQKLWDLLPQGFVLMESDVLIKASIDHLWNSEFASVGHNQMHQPRNPFYIGRVCPMLCYMNVPLLQKYGAKYFDPTRTYGLLKGRDNRNNWYDTGAVMFEDIVKTKPGLNGKHVDIRELVEHYSSGSWRNNNVQYQKEWLQEHKELWSMCSDDAQACRVAVCAIGRYENRYAVEWVEHYKKLGVDKIFIYDNNRPEDGEVFADVLQCFVDAGLVEIVPWDGLQKQAYEECYNRHQKEYDWMGFFDFDEFVMMEEEKSVQQFLDAYEDADVVVMNWKEMTDNGLVMYDDRPLVERFTQGTDDTWAINQHTKCFVRGGIRGISFNDPHCPNHPEMVIVNVRGEQVEQIPLQEEVIHAVAWVNHYDTKTADEYVNVKWKRGTCCGDAYTAQKRRSCVEYFFGINERTPEKEAILGVGKPETKKRANRKGK